MPILIIHGSGGEMARNVKRLCPTCRIRNVLWVYPGGFSSCANVECKARALDASMEWADSNAPISREEASVPRKPS